MEEGRLSQSVANMQIVHQSPPFFDIKWYFPILLVFLL